MELIRIPLPLSSQPVVTLTLDTFDSGRNAVKAVDGALSRPVGPYESSVPVVARHRGRTGRGLWTSGDLFRVSQGRTSIKGRTHGADKRGSQLADRFGLGIRHWIRLDTGGYV